MPQNSNFRLPHSHRFYSKNGSYGYGAKSRWGPLGSMLGPMGSHWVQKMGQNRKNLHAPKFEFSTTRGDRIFAKYGIYSYAAKSRWGHPRGHLGANGVPLGPKNGSKRRKLPCPKIRIFDDPSVIEFSQKMEVTVMAPNQGGDPLGSILRPMESHWVKKMGENRKNYHAPKFEFSSIFLQQIEVMVFGAKSRWGHPRVHFGANGVPLGKKNGSKRRKSPYPKLEFSTTLWLSIFQKKIEVTFLAQNQGGDPRGSILGPMGSHWVKKMGQNRKKLPCRKIRILDDPAVIDFSQKLEVTVMAPNNGGDPLGSIFGPMGSYWVKKNGSKP